MIKGAIRLHPNVKMYLPYLYPSLWPRFHQAADRDLRRHYTQLNSAHDADNADNAGAAPEPQNDGSRERSAFEQVIAPRRRLALDAGTAADNQLLRFCRERRVDDEDGDKPGYM